jgi:hypothetical protein
MKSPSPQIDTRPEFEDCKIGAFVKELSDFNNEKFNEFNITDNSFYR